MGERPPNPELWDLAAARTHLRRAIEQSQANRTASAQARFKRDYERLEMKRRQLAVDAQLIAQQGTPEDFEAFTQRIIRFFRELGELDQRAAGE